ncbi:FkbM family methyltransferase, partial [Micromonospora tarensis]|uniref:FkbM family methyltransferase n=1 Tax=Micromonospora tarensis TaxID=2806100 RepID=UPI003898F139
MPSESSATAISYAAVSVASASAESAAIVVPVVTVDALVEQYGVPTFAKIDVEGFEDEVLAG